MSHYFERAERAIAVETLTLWDLERTTQEPGQCYILVAVMRFRNSRFSFCEVFACSPDRPIVKQTLPRILVRKPSERYLGRIVKQDLGCHRDGVRVHGT